MSHWSQRYVGRAYVEGQFDCADMAQLVQKEVFGRDVAIPGSRDYAGKVGIAKVRAMSAQMERVKPDLVERTTQPSEGDAVLLIARGYVEHIGIYCVIAGEPYVLHAASNSKQVVLTRVRSLADQGLRLEGCYRWI